MQQPISVVVARLTRLAEECPLWPNSWCEIFLCTSAVISVFLKVNKNFTISTLPFMTAACNGYVSSIVTGIIRCLGKTWANNITTSKCPANDAAYKAVIPLSTLGRPSALYSINSLTISICPPKLALPVKN